METRVKSGTGLSLHKISREEMKVEIDFSGNYEGCCYRNDASIFFFAANSYKQAFYLIGKELERRFASGARDKEIEHLILPYCFNFRHYVELELKGYIVAIGKVPPEKTHDLNRLLMAVIRSLENVKNEERDMFTGNADDYIKKALSSLDVIKESISEYLKSEPAAEFYRFIFDNDMKKLQMKETTVALDFMKTKALFNGVMQEFNSIFLCLKESGIYIYQL